MLYIVSTPIGNPDDITLRALNILRAAHAIVCEERRVGERLLKQYQIAAREIVDLNEHTERERVPALVARLKRGETLALISDHGTPLLADPGGRLVQRAIAEGVRVSAVPGASALLAAVVASGLPLARFRFVGFLPAKKEERRAALAQLKNERSVWVVFDTPYRLSALLADLLDTVGKERQIVVACNLTLPEENIVRGKAAEVVKHFEKNPFKGEFVIIVQGHSTTNSQRAQRKRF